MIMSEDAKFRHSQIGIYLGVFILVNESTAPASVRLHVSAVELGGPQRRN